MRGWGPGTLQELAPHQQGRRALIVVAWDMLLPGALIDAAICPHAARSAAAQVPGGLAAAPPRPAAFYSLLRVELAAVGWERVVHLSQDLSSVTLALSDQRGRRHELRLALPPGYPAAAPAAAADLPAPFQPRWAPGGAGGLPGLVRQFEEALGAHQEVWAHLDDLDENAWVIEPASPRPRGALSRRIALGGHVTLGLTLDPARPSATPACQLMGADAAVAPLRAALHAHTGARWRGDVLLRHNLEAVLELELPARPGGRGGGGGGGGMAAEEDASADCAICYAYRLLPAEGGEGEGERTRRRGGGEGPA